MGLATNCHPVRQDGFSAFGMTKKRFSYSLFWNTPQYTLFASQILHKLLFSNAPGDTAYSQEHLKKIVYAKGHSKIENSIILGKGCLGDYVSICHRSC